MVSFFLIKHAQELFMGKLALLSVQVNKCKMVLNSRRFPSFFFLSLKLNSNSVELFLLSQILGYHAKFQSNCYSQRLEVCFSSNC